MNILVFGAGAIGTIYGYVLAKAGNDVIHYVRENRAKQLAGGIKVHLLDGRDPKDVREIYDVYSIKTVTHLDVSMEYDLILVSVKHGVLNSVLDVLKESGVKGDVLFFNGLWKDYNSIDPYLDRGRYLWGYPVAGGNIEYEKMSLQGALLDNIILGEPEGKKTKRQDRISRLFEDADIKAETPANVLHWIWIHMAINAGVISTCLKCGSAAAFMDSAKALREGILTMREALEVVKARGVNLDVYRDELRMYYMPAWIGAVMFKFYFKKNVLSRRIMDLHNNPDDLYELCNDVYASAQKLGIVTPQLAAKSGYFLGK